MLTGLLGYVAFSAVALVGPGLALQRLARTRLDPALVLPLGMVAAAATYALGLVVGAPWLFPVLIGVLDLSLLVRGGSWVRAYGSPSLRGALPPLLGAVVLLAVTQYPLNRFDAQDRFLLDPMGDHPLHVGIAHELVVGGWPQVPGLSGVPLVYHYGADLVRAAALRWAGVEPYDAISRYEVTLGVLALMVALRSAAHAVGAPPLAVSLVPWTLLAADLSFLLVPFFPDLVWWADLLRGNLLMSLAFDNPVVPALSLALGALVALGRHQAGEGRGWLVLALLQAAAVPAFKVMLGAHLLLGLAAAFLVSARALRSSTLLLALSTLPGLVALGLAGTGERVEVAFAPLNMVVESLSDMGASTSRAALLGWTPAWLIASLGLRILGLPVAWRALRTRSPAAAALGAMALAGWPLGLLFRGSARGIGGAPLPSAMVYFVEQSGCVLWLFTAIALVTLSRRLGPRWTLAAAAALSLPSTVEFAIRRAHEPGDPMPAPVTRAMRALRAQSAPGDVVLQRPGGRYPPAPVILAGRRVPYERYTPYLTQFAPRQFLDRRHGIVFRFFRAHDGGEALALARRLAARFVCLYGSDRVRFDGAGVLVPVHEEPGARCYRLAGPAASGP